MPWNALTDSITPAMCSWADDGGPVNGWVPCAPIDNTLFQVCFCIQAEACEAAGHHIPLIVENVNRAQRWVGLARWHYGSYYLWGDVPALMPWSGRFDKALDERRKEAAVKVSGDCTTARKAASAQIAKIPFELARWIAYCFKP